jgi:dTDP-4-dehydrorhamnose reductase
MARVLVLGGTGMLGHVVTRVLAQDPALDVSATARAGTEPPDVPSAAWQELDAERTTAEALVQLLADVEYVVNAIGVIKPYIDESQAASVDRAIAVNAGFPFRLAEAAEQTGTKILQIATDCVYSGRCGPYTEDAPHDPTDVYGKTKSLGEVPSPAMMHLRCSIIGLQITGAPSLVEWFLSQPHGASLNGFTNHRWNGVTTLHFAQLARGIMGSRLFEAGVVHIVPGDEVTKAELLDRFAASFGRQDVKLQHVVAGVGVDRRLATARRERNDALWRAAGHTRPPRIDEMVSELAGQPVTSEMAGMRES